jgi:hypothetical protein
MSHTESELDVVSFNVFNYLEVPKDGKPPTVAPTQSARLYRNIPEFYYTGIIHETIDDSVSVMSRKGKLRAALCAVELHHYGFLKEKKRVRHKMDYYETLNLRQIEVTEQMDPRPYFNLALHYLNDGKLFKCSKSLLKSILGSGTHINRWQH